MVPFSFCKMLTMVVLGASVAAEPPRRPGGPDGVRPPTEDGPPPRFDGDRMRARLDAQPGQPDGLDEGPNGRPPFQWGRMSAAEREKLKRFVEEHFPRLAVELDKLREQAPRRFERRIMRIGPEMRRLMEITERDPQRGLILIRERQIAIQLQQLVREYHQTTDETKRAELREKIRGAVSQEFQSRMGRRTAEVRQMETKLAELKARLTEMSSLRDDIISRRVRELLEKPPPPPDRVESGEGPGRPGAPPDAGPDYEPIEREP